MKHLELIDQAYATAVEIYDADQTETGWDRVFRVLDRLKDRLDDLDAQPQTEEVT